MKAWKNAFVLGALMFGNYLGNTISFRMVSHGSYLGVAVTDALIAWYGFTMVQNVAQAEALRDKIGYTLGGVLGSLLGLWVSMHIGK